jgi:hypothetical protein
MPPENKNFQFSALAIQNSRSRFPQLMENDAKKQPKLMYFNVILNICY